jgi:hypothetical protein
MGEASRRRRSWHGRWRVFRKPAYDRLSLLDQEGLDEERALAIEFEHGLRSLADVEPGLHRFRFGAGRHGRFD